MAGLGRPPAGSNIDLDLYYKTLEYKPECLSAFIFLIFLNIYIYTFIVYIYINKYIYIYFFL